MEQDKGASDKSDRATAAEPVLTAEDQVRFGSKIKIADDGCFVWTAAKTKAGYGSFYVRGKMYAAHRIALSMRGPSIGRGLVVDHICRNRLCVNPDHLRAVDRFTNVHENSDASAHLNSLKTHCPKGHAYEGNNLIVRSNGFRCCRACSNEYSRRRRARK